MSGFLVEFGVDLQTCGCRMSASLPHRLRKRCQRFRCGNIEPRGPRVDLKAPTFAVYYATIYYMLHVTVLYDTT